MRPICWLLLVALPLLLAACGEPDVSASARCEGEPFVNGETPADPSLTLVMVDLASNSRSARETIVGSVRPTVEEAVAEGGAIRLVVSGGSGKPMRVSPCLDGKTILHSDYNNSTTEKNEQAHAITAIEGDIAAFLEETEVSRVGNVTNLIAEIPEQLRQLGPEGDSGANLGPARVVLVSELISPLARGDCMSLDRVPATLEAAEKIVAQCIAFDQFHPLPEGSALEVVRPQLTPGGSADSLMSKYLAASLCAQVTGEEGSCPGS